MKKRIFQSDRRFQVWQYTVSHGQLLIRSTKEGGHETQVDVLFKNVRALNIPVTFDGLAIERDQSMGGDSFDVSGEKWAGTIIAGAVAWDETSAEHFEESRLLSLSQPPAARGRPEP